MAQKCFASISDTGLHCAWCITRNVIENGLEMLQAYCDKHKKPCKDMGYYCSCFIGYKPDYRMTDEEERKLVNTLRTEQLKEL